MNEISFISDDVKFIQDFDCRVGVYGFAKSYGGPEVAKGTQLPPYFFRGELENLTVDRGDLTVSQPTNSLSEEFELVCVIEVKRGTTCHLIGVTFGNDLTDLDEFRLDPSRILHAKSPQAGVSNRWWPCCKAPSSLNVNIKRIRRDGSEMSYNTKIGFDYLTIDPETAVNAVQRMAGWSNFDIILLFTGAPRGFAWMDSPSIDGDSFIFSVESLGVVLENTVKCI